MRWSRFAVAGFLVLSLTLLGTAGTETKGNAKKILGHWEVTKAAEKGGPPKGTTVHFTKDGKLKVHVKFKDKDFDLEGTYKVEGNKLTTIIEFGGKSKEDTDTIKTLTADKLVTEDDKGQVVEFKRLKKKQKE